MVGGKIMRDVYVDIREETESIKKQFPCKDFVSIDDLLDAIDDLQYEIDKLQEEIDEANETEHEKQEKGVYEMIDLQYKENKLREMEGLE